jgi:predicted glycoside hydrolase/deacetylase ChbG (UPF0249 family)
MSSNHASAAERPFVLCADDFAITEGVSRGILDLAGEGHISATSAMVTRPHWARLARELDGLRGQISVGLHLNLTLAEPLAAMPRLAPSGTLPTLGELTRLAFVSRLPIDEVLGEVNRQLDAFCAGLQRPPDFVDGHQHVHVLPGIRASIISALGERGFNDTWLRNPAERHRTIVRRGVAPLKSIVIAGLAFGLADAVRDAGLSANEGFAGVSPFDPTRDYGTDFARYLVDPGPRHLVMCHPGHADEELVGLDPIVATREQELSFFKSTRFLDVCAEARLKAAPFWG